METSAPGGRKTSTRATLYHFGVESGPSNKSSEREAKPKPAEPKRDQPTGDERPVDEKKPVTRFG